MTERDSGTPMLRAVSRRCLERLLTRRVSEAAQPYALAGALV
jgi:hypothetical protein